MLHSGNAAEASAYLRETVPARLSKQLGADGSQPEEMKRTCYFHYPVFNLEAFSIIAL